MLRKNYIFLFTFLIATSSEAQNLSLGNFTYKDNTLTWQKVFDTDLSIEEMKSQIKSLSIVDRVISEDESSIVISCKRIDHDFRALGGTQMNTSIYISRKSSVGNVVFQLKSNRYRVTFADITLEQEYTVNAGYLTEKEGELQQLALYALKMNRKKWRANFQTTDYLILDYTYSRVFNLSSTTVLDDDF